ncbi:1-acyl-sn-glycerol-3-phosphate acyltransferase [Ahrensia sp. R2A130]|uniref:lysophospholipid acyltransferase family protein n=1 Tax=Ahrensia sp. R2A130 TaxID=744979 RepID=UPI0001E0E8ED|nr:1-acyl-sn-glycerol-3-phosphate acyltransferase [Ahrensia sp. R2A130]EFL88007.1 phospholipid/glycerol acyltransferase [Ahrensia sp. R2A130]
MLALRSVLFNIVWVFNLIFQMVIQTPFYFFMSFEGAEEVPKRWARSSYWLQRWMVGTKMEILGRENIPVSGQGALIAAKHQCNWDFYAINEMLPSSAFVLKEQLMKLPFFGWYVAKLRHIPIRREDKGKAMRRMLKIAAERVEEGRQILIFPEGSRMAAGAPPNYRYGITRMYLDLNTPVVPVALNSGLYWPRHSFKRYPGTLRCAFLEPIQPGLDSETFAAELERRIEEGCEDLYLMATRDEHVPPMSAEVKAGVERARLREKARLETTGEGASA